MWQHACLAICGYTEHKAAKRCIAGKHVLMLLQRMLADDGDLPGKIASKVACVSKLLWAFC